MENQFQPGSLKQAREVTFSRKITKSNHPTSIFNDNPVHQVVLQKHLAMFLDFKQNFEEHLKKYIYNEVNKTIGLRHRLLTKKIVTCDI